MRTLKVLVYLALLTAGHGAERLDIRLTDGTVYKDAKISSETPSHLVVFNADGMFSVPKSDLVPELQERFPYDLAGAEAEAAARAEALEAIERKKRSDVVERIARKGLTFTPIRSNRVIPMHRSHYTLTQEAVQKAVALGYKEVADVPYEQVAKDGGVLLIRVESLVIEGANTKHFTVIVYDKDENEIVRHYGEDDVAEVPGKDERWWNLMAIDLPTLDNPPYRVRVVESTGLFVDFIAR